MRHHEVTEHDEIVSCRHGSSHYIGQTGKPSTETCVLFAEESFRVPSRVPFRVPLRPQPK